MKIDKNSISTLILPDDLNDFFENPVFKEARNELIKSYKDIDVDYFTNSFQGNGEVKFDKPISFLRPLVLKFSISEIVINSLEDTLSSFCFAELPISKLTLSNEVKNIPSKLFSNIKTLKEIVLTEGLEKIGDEAFIGCRNLQSIYIPSSVGKIGNNILGNCIFLNSINVDERNKNYSSLNSNIIVDLKNMEVIQGCSTSKLPEGIKSVGSKAFWKLPMLKEINLPKSLEAISEEAFIDCISLTNVSYNGTIEEFNKIIKNKPCSKVKCANGIC